MESDDTHTPTVHMELSSDMTEVLGGQTGPSSRGEEPSEGKARSLAQGLLWSEGEGQ